MQLRGEKIKWLQGGLKCVSVSGHSLGIMKTRMSGGNGLCSRSPSGFFECTEVFFCLGRLHRKSIASTMGQHRSENAASLYQNGAVHKLWMLLSQLCSLCPTLIHPGGCLQRSVCTLEVFNKI